MNCCRNDAIDNKSIDSAIHSLNLLTSMAAGSCNIASNITLIRSTNSIYDKTSTDRYINYYQLQN